ncbi:MAG: hypothetical protein K6F72_04025 [Bacteroidales bacterium]|nr:hypothetical protein [Bacteroidales bacterium]
MKVRKKAILPALLLSCVVLLSSCDTYYFGLKPTKHRSRTNKENMYVHKATVNGNKQYPTSRNAKPVGMHKQRKVK